MLRFDLIDDGSGDAAPCWLNTPCVLAVETVATKGADGVRVVRDDLAGIHLVDGTVFIVVGKPAMVAERIRCQLEGIEESEPCTP